MSARRWPRWLGAWVGVLALVLAPVGAEAQAKGSGKGASKRGARAARPKAEPVLVAADQPGARSLRVDRRNLYFLRDDGIARVGKTGEGVKLLAAAEEPFHLELQRDRLYWTEPRTGALRTVRVDGGEATALLADRKDPRWLASDAYALYWVEEGAEQPVLFTMRRSGNGSSTTELAHAFASFHDLKASGAHLYWTDNDGALQQMSKFGGAPERLHQARVAPAGRVVTDERWLFWTNPVAKSVMRRPRSGGRPVVLVQGEGAPASLALDKTNVFWASNDPSRNRFEVLRVPKKGGKPSTVVAREAEIIEVVMDDGWLYWIEEAPAGGGGRRLFKLKV